MIVGNGTEAFGTFLLGQPDVILEVGWNDDRCGEILWREPLSGLVDFEIEQHTFTNGPRKGETDDCAELRRLATELRAAATKIELAIS